MNRVPPIILAKPSKKMKTSNFPFGQTSRIRFASRLRATCYCVSRGERTPGPVIGCNPPIAFAFGVRSVGVPPADARASSYHLDSWKHMESTQAKRRVPSAGFTPDLAPEDTEAWKWNAWGREPRGRISMELGLHPFLKFLHPIFPVLSFTHLPIFPFHPPYYSL